MSNKIKNAFLQVPNIVEEQGAQLTQKHQEACLKFEQTMFNDIDNPANKLLERLRDIRISTREIIATAGLPPAAITPVVTEIEELPEIQAPGAGPRAAG